MAVLAMDNDVYYNSQYTLLEKVRKAVFWEHLGPESKETDGMASTWTDNDIKSILAIEPLGGTHLSDDEINETCS